MFINIEYNQLHSLMLSNNVTVLLIILLEAMCKQQWIEIFSKISLKPAGYLDTEASSDVNQQIYLIY
jgi:hypothetical protein